MTGKFIVFEGIDGSGKSTQLKLLKEKLDNLGIRSQLTAEPSPGLVGQLLRNIQKGEDIQNPSPYTMAFLYAADRSLHVDWIKEKLSDGVWILCDRYKYSSIAYQGSDDFDLLNLVEDMNSIFLEPDHAFLLNLSPDTALARTENRETREIFEKKDFLEKVARNYKKIFSIPENRSFMSIVDTNASEEAVSDKIFNILQKKYKL